MQGRGRINSLYVPYKTHSAVQSQQAPFRRLRIGSCCRASNSHGGPMTTKTESRKLPMIPIRDMVIFPYMMTPFVVGRESSVRALEEALTGDRKIFLATQHDAGIDEPRPDDIYPTGTIGNIVQSVKMPDGNI